MRYPNSISRSSPWLSFFNSCNLLFVLLTLVGAFIVDPGRSMLIMITLFINLVLLLIAFVNIIYRPAYFRAFLPTIALLTGTIVLGFVIENFHSTYAYRMIIILASIIMFTRLRLSGRMLNTFFIASFSLLIYFFLQSFGYVDSFSESTAYLSNTETVANPNTMGLMTFVLFIMADRASSQKNKIFAWILPIISLWAVTNYGSRTALACIIIYIVMSNIMRYIKSYELYKKTIFYVIVVMIAFIFPLLYLGNYSSKENSIVLGKSVYSGRQDIWLEVKNELFDQKLYFGSQDQLLLRNVGGGGLHNMYIDMVYRMGILFSIVFYTVIGFSVVRYKLLTAKTYAVLICILIYGYAESVFLGGTYVGMIMPLMLLTHSEAT